MVCLLVREIFSVVKIILSYHIEGVVVKVLGKPSKYSKYFVCFLIASDVVLLS